MPAAKKWPDDLPMFHVEHLDLEIQHDRRLEDDLEHAAEIAARCELFLERYYTTPGYEDMSQAFLAEKLC